MSLWGFTNSRRIFYFYLRCYHTGEDCRTFFKKYNIIFSKLGEKSFRQFSKSTPEVGWWWEELLMIYVDSQQCFWFGSGSKAKTLDKLYLEIKAQREKSMQDKCLTKFPHNCCQWQRMLNQHSLCSDTEKWCLCNNTNKFVSINKHSFPSIFV